MKIGFDNTTGELMFVFTMDELSEGLQILDMFEDGDSPEITAIKEKATEWINALQHKQ